MFLKVKKKNRRNSAKYPALIPSLNLKTRQDLLDQDYIPKLPDTKIKHCNNHNGDCKICNNPKTQMMNPKDYLNGFNEEYVNAKMDNESPKKNKHRTKARNRDILTRQKATGRLVNYDKVKEKVKSPEDIMVGKEESSSTVFEKTVGTYNRKNKT